jgi:hypothetical protein
VSRRPCAEIGWETGVCFGIEPERSLWGGVRYRIAVGSAVRDLTGAPLDDWSAGFLTAVHYDDAPPRWVSLPCAVDERPIEVGCALVDDRGARLRLKADEPARIAISIAEHRRSVVAARGIAEFELEELPAEPPARIEVRAIDGAGNESVRSLALHLEQDLARLSITEVRADPRGPEPVQEYVEILNYGEGPVDLLGFALSDDPDDIGDVIERSVVVHPGARALLVADRFDPDEPRDAAPAPGAMLVGMGTSLARSGLSNAGEPLYLRDPAGRRVSASPAAPTPRSGVCIVRVVDNMRTGSEGAFVHDPDDRCTPGR